MKRILLVGAVLTGGLVLSGCASLSPKTAFSEVADTVKSRTGKRIEWDVNSPDDAKARAHISGLLARQLTPASAVQIALLNNKSLQANYANLGMAQADLVQAGLLSNPIVDGEFIFPYKPETAAANIVLSVVFNFIELFWRRYKEAVAESALEEVKIQISGLVIDHAANTNRAYVEYVAARQEIELLSQVTKSARATVAAAKAIREAGNSTPLDFEQQQNVLTQAKLALAAAQANAAAAREKLNVLMGLSGNQTRRWTVPKRLAPPGGRPISVANIESVAVERSLNLDELRQKIITLGYKYQLTHKQSIIPDLGLGVQLEMPNSGEREIGPRFDVTVPLFDRGEAKRARSIMEIRQAQDQYWAMGIKVRSAARLARAGLLTARKTARYFQKAVLPQQARLLLATQRQYNAMQEDVFRLVRAKREQIQASQAYIAALRSYWLARIDVQQIKSGRLPAGGGGGVVVAAAGGGGGGGGAGGH